MYETNQIPPKVLIIQTAFIGDVILATGLIESLKNQNPSSQIHFLLRKGNETLLLNDDRIENVWIWDKKKKWNSFFNIVKGLRNERYDIVLCVQRFFMAGLFTLFSKAKLKYGFSKNPLSMFFTRSHPHSLGNGMHEIGRNFSLLGGSFKYELEKPKLSLQQSDLLKVQSFTVNKYITISPASVWFTKQFPKDKWVTFINTLDDYNVYLLGGPGDVDLCKYILECTSHKNTQILSGKLSFLESAALMQKAVMNYVNDSAPLHLCSATNSPVTSIFCSTVPDFGFTPLSDKSFIVEYPERLDCRPCGIHGKKQCPKGDFECSNIDIAHLSEKLDN